MGYYIKIHQSRCRKWKVDSYLFYPKVIVVIIEKDDIRKERERKIMLTLWEQLRKSTMFMITILIVTKSYGWKHKIKMEKKTKVEETKTKTNTECINSKQKRRTERWPYGGW